MLDPARLEAVADTLMARIEDEAEIGSGDLLGDLSYALSNIMDCEEAARHALKLPDPPSGLPPITSDRILRGYWYG